MAALPTLMQGRTRVYVRNTAARAVCPHGMTLQDYENWWVREWIRQQNPHQPRHH